MSLTYIAGYDGTPASASAVRLARSLGEARGADVIVATVYQPLPVVYGKGSAAGADAELEEQIRKDADGTLAGLDEQGVLRRTVPGDSPAHGLQRLAEREEAALIAVGATHRGTAARHTVGSIGHRLLHGSPCPVLVVPADASGEIRTIAVGFDDEEESHAALHTAALLATGLGARLVLVAAVEPLSYSLSAGPDGGWEIERVIQQKLETACEQAVAGLPPGLGARSRVIIGPAGRGIVNEVRDDADLVVSGSRGYGPLRSVLLGSTSSYLVDHAPCPVLVVPRGARADLDGSTHQAAPATAEPRAWRV